MANRVQELWRYPAKSMQGQRIESARVDARGLVGDRMWAVRDLDRGGIRGAKHLAELMRLRAEYVADPAGTLPPPAIVVTAPDDQSVRSDDPHVDGWLSDHLGRNVRLEPLPPADDAAHFRRGAPDNDDLLTELRSIFGRELDEPLPDLSKLPPTVIEYETPPGTYHDVHPVHLLTTSSLARLQELAPDSLVDVRRFRPTVVVDTGDDPVRGWLEQSWVGSVVRLGDVELDIVSGCPRCVMTTRAVADLPADRAPLRQIVRHGDQNFGVYATVRTPGRVRVGDPVEVAGNSSV